MALLHGTWVQVLKITELAWIWDFPKFPGTPVRGAEKRCVNVSGLGVTCTPVSVSTVQTDEWTGRWRNGSRRRKVMGQRLDL